MGGGLMGGLLGSALTLAVSSIPWAGVIGIGALTYLIAEPIAD
jgi:hypothetical protein